MEGELCTACWTGHLQLHQGMLVCEVCGSIHQGFAEETQEYQTGISDARFFKKSEGMKSKAADKAAAEAELPPPVPVAEAVRAYVHAVQQLLQRQVRTLIDTFGMDPALADVLRELWLAFLAHSRLLEPATILKLEALAEPVDAAAGKEGDSASEGRRVPAQMTFQHRRSFRIAAEVAPALQLQHTLVLLLLACWHQLEAASPLDILRWALDGQLPYLSFAVDEGAVLQQYRNILGGKLITVKGVPSPHFILMTTARVAHHLGLVCPPLSPALWLRRYLAELELPQELLPVALQLHSLYQPAPLVPTQASRPSRHPWALLMATLVVAVKLCYGVDSGTRGMQGLPPAPAWSDWAPRQLSRFSSISAFPLSTAEAAQLDEPSFRAYMQYLQQGLLADCAPPPDLETVHQLFQKLSLPVSNDEAVRGARAGGVAPMTDGEQQQQQQQHQQQQPPIQQGQPQKSGAQQHFDAHQLQQRAYHFYGAGAWHKGLFHTDYVMLLTACAALVWMVPEGLHELLSGLEHAMIGAECEVSFLYNAEEQARLARVREEGAWQKQREAEAREQQRLKKQGVKKQ